jgi:hypothetical protein
VDAPEWCSLRHCPEHAALGHASPLESCHGLEILRTTPKGVQGATCKIIVALLAVNALLTRKYCVVGRGAETEHLCVEADRNVRGVAARLEQEGEPIITELTIVSRLVTSVFCEGSIHLGLNVGGQVRG